MYVCMCTFFYFLVSTHSFILHFIPGMKNNPPFSFSPPPRQLEEELKSEKQRHREAETEYKSELDRLRRDNDRQQKLLAQNLTKGGGSQPETLLQSEIMRLTSENLVSVVCCLSFWLFG